MGIIKKTIILTVSRDGHYLRLHRCRRDFLEILQYRECTELLVDINGTIVNITNALHVYNDPSCGATTSPELSTALINAGLHAKDKLVAELTINYQSHKYSIIGKVSQL